MAPGLCREAARPASNLCLGITTLSCVLLILVLPYPLAIIRSSFPNMPFVGCQGHLVAQLCMVEV